MSLQTASAKRFLVAILATASFCAFAAENEIIREIKITSRGSTEIDESFVRSHISSEVGKALDQKMVSADVRQLLDSMRFSYVGTKIEAVKDGVRVVYVIERRLRITGKIEFIGLDGIRHSKALEAIGIASGDFADEQIIGAAAERLRKAYVEKRYFDVEIQPVLSPIPNNPGAAKLTFKINEKTRNKVNLIDIEGNHAIKDRNLRRASGQSPWWNPSGWFATDRVSDFDLELMKADMRKQYLDAGYLDVKVSDPHKERSGNTWDIAFNVIEGPKYKIGSTELEGVTLFPEPLIKSATPLKAGDVAGLTSIDAGRTAVRDYFSSRGYVDTRVQTSTYPALDKPGVLNVVYTVTEGELTKIRNILIRGNTSTKDKVIRREILLNPGDIYDGVQAERSKKRLDNLGYFSDVRNYDATVNDETRDLIYELDEKSTGSMMVGAGFSSVDHLIGMFEISQSNFDLTNFKNFRGAGQKARLSLQVSADSTDLETSFVEPWFLDRRIALNVDGFIRNREYSEYDESRDGFSVGLAKHVPWVGRIGLTYTLQQIQMDDVFSDPLYLYDDPDTDYSFLDEDDDYLLGSMRLSWTYDTRDNPMVPHSGTRATAYSTLYNSAFGSDHDFYELDLRWKNYQPLWYGHVLSFSLRGCVADAMGDDEVPIGNRFFLGGGRSLRGFKYRNVGPKAIEVDSDGSTFHPIGGLSMLDGSVEYTIPIVKVLRFGLFYDFGNVWSDAYDFDMSEYASSVGAGLRLDIPGFPVRLDFANAIEKDDDLTRERSFVFWIGFDN